MKYRIPYCTDKIHRLFFPYRSSARGSTKQSCISKTTDATLEQVCGAAPSVKINFLKNIVFLKNIR